MSTGSSSTRRSIVVFQQLNGHALNGVAGKVDGHLPIVANQEKAQKLTGAILVLGQNDDLSLLWLFGQAEINPLSL